MRAHKLALQAQHGFWREMMQDSVQFNGLQARIKDLEKAERQATQVYQRCVAVWWSSADWFPGSSCDLLCPSLAGSCH